MTTTNKNATEPISLIKSCDILIPLICASRMVGWRHWIIPHRCISQTPINTRSRQRPASINACAHVYGFVHVCKHTRTRSRKQTPACTHPQRLAHTSVTQTFVRMCLLSRSHTQTLMYNIYFMHHLQDMLYGFVLVLRVGCCLYLSSSPIPDRCLFIQSYTSPCSDRKLHFLRLCRRDATGSTHTTVRALLPVQIHAV